MKPPSLTLKYIALLATTTLALCTLFALLSAQQVRRDIDRKLFAALECAKTVLTESGNPNSLKAEVPPALSELPYYIIYTIYNRESIDVLTTNDPLLPLLDSRGKCRTHVEKGYFIDADLALRYLTATVSADGADIIAEVAIDIEHDSATNTLKALPRLIAVSILPVLAVSIALSALISKGAIEQYKQLESRYDREKEFTANVSHELKTPIAIISGHANLIRRWGKDDREQLDKSIQAIITACNNMSSIVSTLLSLTRIERGTTAVSTETFAVRDLFAELEREFASLYPALRISIDDSEGIALTSDRDKIHQVFTAILSNSVKFAGKDCRITMSAQRTEKHVVITLSDDGEGFAKGSLDKVFDRFYKADPSHNRAQSGSGLGLSIAKSLITLLGGTIHASNATDKGAVITISLPDLR